MKHLLIAYFLSKISTKKYQSRITYMSKVYSKAN